MKIEKGVPLKIEKGVPLPRSAPPLGQLTAILRVMEIGDSVLVTDRSRQHIANSLSLQARLSGRRFTQRKVDGGQRVWRVE